MGCTQSSVDDVEAQKGLLDFREKNEDNTFQELFDQINSQFKTCWSEFLEEKCIVARDRYVPVKTLIHAFDFHLSRDEAFMKLYRAYNKVRYPKYHSVGHLVHLHIYTLIEEMRDKGVSMSSGFGPDKENGNRYYHYDYVHHLFIDDRIVIGISLERFRKAS